MEYMYKCLAGAVRMAKKLAAVDRDVQRSELLEISKFLQLFDVDEETLDDILDYSDVMDDLEAVDLITQLDDDGKRMVSKLLVKVACADGELPDEERELYFRILNICRLPDPNAPEKEETVAEEPAGDTEVIPAFLLVEYNGMTSVRQSENLRWADLRTDIASWLEADRVEIVRYTQRLNDLTRQLNLNGRHLVLMVDRNGSLSEDSGDNMTATLLYGGGYPLYGHALIGLETDDDYTIEGIRTQSLINEVFAAVDQAVGGLLRTE